MYGHISVINLNQHLHYKEIIITLRQNPVLKDASSLGCLKAILMNNFGPVILIEVVLVFGGVLLFAWWQLRDLRKEREKDQKNKVQDEQQGNS